MDIFNRNCKPINKCTWLPKLDQLQAMVNHEYLTGFLYELYEFSKEWLYFDNGNDIRFTSMEQLWLAFIMKENYNRYWIENNWVKITYV